MLRRGEIIAVRSSGVYRDGGADITRINRLNSGVVLFGCISLHFHVAPPIGLRSSPRSNGQGEGEI